MRPPAFDGSGPAWLVAEIGSNHDGSLEKARALIDASAEAGWDAVKFQLFRADHLYPKECGVVELATGPVDFYAELARVELDAAWLPELRAHAESRGLHFLCTPFDEDAVDELVAAGVPALKIASPELNHLPLLRRAAASGLPLICSTGLSTLSDVEEALGAIRGVRPGASITVLQCVTAYPAPPEESNLAVLETLARAFGVPVGLSDHSTDPELVPAVAVACGASLIEKHVTLDRRDPGLDHAFAIEPEGMRRLREAVRRTESFAPEARLAQVERTYGRERVRATLGHGRKEVMPSEAPLYPCDKRSIHAIRAIRAGEPLAADAIRVVRSERNLRPGLHPRHWEDVLGARARVDIQPGDGIRWTHLIER